jgi:murein L,D-transpeptidase YcbB/YkuD
VLRVCRVCVVVLFTAAAASRCGGSVDRDAFAQALGQALEQQAGIVRDGAVTAAVRAFYEQRQNQPAWTDNSAVADAVAVIASASAHGLVPADYDGPGLSQAFEEMEKRAAKDQGAAEGWAALDARVTTALMRVGRDVSTGRVPPTSIDAQWKPRMTPSGLGASLAESWRGRRLSTWLDTIAPPHAGYARLRASLATLEAAHSRDNARVDVVRMNLDRWRWLPTDLGMRYLVANSPEYTLRAIEDGRTAFEMRVVVGGLGDRQTPLFSDVMETVVFNPYWHIPKSIAQGETAPAVAKDPDYLESHNIEVLDAASGHRHVDPEDVDWNDKDALKSLVFRQRPGDDNALGDVKFLFPNRHAVYMHDTPSTTFFQRPMRALSHGCVRVAEPEKLAAYVLRDQPAWNAATIATNMSGDREQHVKLTQPLPVHLVYFTATVDDRGNLVFFDDVYKLDEKQLRSLPRPKV